MVDIVYDTKRMMGGTHKYSIDTDEYNFAAINIYLYIIDLCICILAIVGIAKD